MLVYRSGTGDLKRVPCGELLSYAITEDLADVQMGLDCPRSRDIKRAEETD